MRYFHALLPLLLTACASPPTQTEIINSDPVSSFASEKHPKAIALCLTERWEDKMLSGSSRVVSMRETGTGYNITLYFSGTPVYVATINQTKLGSKTDIREGKVIQIGENLTLKAASRCQ